MRKEKKPDATTDLVSVITGKEQIRSRNDIAFDIETAPLGPNHEDGTLLHPETARVAAIGYYDSDRHRYFIAADKDEAAMLNQFWDVFRATNAAGYKLIGFNIFGFDLPFLVRRSWLFDNVAIPKSIMTAGGRYWCDTFIDLMGQWKCGSYRDFISLDALGRFLGVGEKNGTGEMFYRLWETDRKAATEYLMNDCRLTYKCAQKMGFVSPMTISPSAFNH